jgi:flagellar basal-body rod modification protein FlgD
MTIVNPITYSPLASTASGSTSGSGKNDMGQDTFFQLLLTQLQNQDPFNPMESTDMTSQLAQFSQLEKLDSMNSSLNYLQLYMASLNNAQAVDFIGKDIEARGDSIELSEDGSASLNYELMDSAGSVTIRIYDENMQLVRTVELGSHDAEKKAWAWDGKDNEENELDAGTYTFEVSATDVDGEEVAVTTYLRGSVTGVTFENGITYLMLGAQKVAVGDVVKVIDHEVVEDEQSPTTTDKAMQILNGIGQFMKYAAPIAAMAL